MPTKKDCYKHTLIDLFCGCGGFTAGFLSLNKTTNWKIVLGIDLDENAVKTFRANFGTRTAKIDDLNTADPREYLIKLNLLPMALDHLHASPPCQNYSNNNRTNRNRSDSRYKIALRWAKVFMPKILTIENVQGLGKIHDTKIRKSLIKLGYRVYRLQLDAADFGVPQNRKRLFYLAYLKSLGIRSVKLKKTHAQPQKCQGIQKPWVTVKNAIGDLPKRKAGSSLELFTSKVDVNRQPNAVSEYARLLRPEKGRVITEHYARALNELALERIHYLRPGQAMPHLPPRLRPKKGFRGAYGKLNPYLPSKTITTGIRGPSHGPFCHYNQDRLITYREAARLQSFPDSFVFKGGQSSKAVQIGNAVPPILASVFRDLSEQILEIKT
jgi:DNA (cytosine-5)-methyltransferase 1